MDRAFLVVLIIQNFAKIQKYKIEGDLVLDLFSGTGITSLVTMDLERKFVGCEMNAEYLNADLKTFKLAIS